MSQKTDDFEKAIANAVKVGDILHSPLPQWINALGINIGDTVTNVKSLGASGGKTDILIVFNNTYQLKISAKLSSADYYGNWYSHTRLIEEFGDDIFDKIVEKSTAWANDWVKNSNASLFIGVSICFGKRTGNTASEFLDIFTIEDIIKIVAGSGDQSDISNANCLLVDDQIPKNLHDLIQKLQPINKAVIESLSKNFKVIYRPINPMTEGSNRGKCIYTRFTPFQKHSNLIVINSLADLVKFGTFQPVSNNSLNHNRHIKDLLNDFNIKIPVK